MIRDNNCRLLLLAVPKGTQGGSTTSENRLLSPDALRRFVADAPRHHRQSRSEDIRLQPIPYTSNNNGNYDMALVSSPTLIPLAALHQLLTFCSLQMSIPILASNNNSYTHHSPLLRSHIILVYFWPLARLLIPTLRLTTTVLFHFGMGHFFPARGLIAERNCGVLWGVTMGTQKTFAALFLS
jgi:hypothetical protein